MSTKPYWCVGHCPTWVAAERRRLRFPSILHTCFRSSSCGRSAGAKFKPSYIPEAADKIDGEGISKFETAEHDTAVAQQQVGAVRFSGGGGHVCAGS